MKRKKRHDPIQKYQNGKISASRKSENGLSEVHGDAVQETSQENLVERTTLMAEMYQGPYPPPQYVNIYEQHCPGFLHRLLTMAEKAQESQIEHQNKLIEHKIAGMERGRRYGFIMFGGLLVTIIILALTGHDEVARWLTIMGSAGVIGQLIWGRSSKPKATKAESEQPEPESLPTAPRAAV